MIRCPDCILTTHDTSGFLLDKPLTAAGGGARPGEVAALGGGLEGGMGDMAGEEEEVVCQHCDSPCWLSEEPCAEEERRRRVGADPTTAGERDSLEAFFLRLLLLDNIKQEAQEEASQQEVLPAASDTPELRQFRPRQPRPATPAEEEPQDEACCRCQAIVYRAELRQCRGRSYHVACFSCLSCRRRLDAMSATEGPDGEAYCPACYRRFLADSSRPVGAGSTTSILARWGVV